MQPLRFPDSGEPGVVYRLSRYPKSVTPGGIGRPPYCPAVAHRTLQHFATLLELRPAAFPPRGYPTLSRYYSASWPTPVSWLPFFSPPWHPHSTESIHAPTHNQYGQTIMFLYQPRLENITGPPFCHTNLERHPLLTGKIAIIRFYGGMTDSSRFTLAERAEALKRDTPPEQTRPFRPQIWGKVPTDKHCLNCHQPNNSSIGDGSLTRCTGRPSGV